MLLMGCVRTANRWDAVVQAVKMAIGAVTHGLGSAYP